LFCLRYPGSLDSNILCKGCDDIVLEAVIEYLM